MSGALIERDPEELNKHLSRLINQEFCNSYETTTTPGFFSLFHLFTEVSNVKSDEIILSRIFFSSSSSFVRDK
jgi:hypothetical protein